ncbi:MAG: VanW family protein [Anaerolineaceae bacterium]
MKASTSSSILRQVFTAFALGVGVIIALLLIWVIGIYLFFSNRVLPGVSLNGISLAGLTESEAMQAIASTYSFPQNGHILIQAGDNSWMVSPAQLGVYLDSENSARQALAVGRKNPFDLFETSLFGYSSSPSFIFDQRVALQYLTNLASLVNQPVKEASLSIQNAQVSINQGQPGRVVDVAASLQALSQQISKMQDGIVELSVTEVKPKVLDVSQQGQLVQNILSQPLVLNLSSEQNSPAAGPWTIAPADLAGLLAFKEIQQDQNTSITVEVNKPLMIAYLRSIEGQITLEPQNARFIFNDDTHLLEIYNDHHAVVGRTLDLENSVANINDSLLRGDHSATLQLNITQPQVTDSMTGAELGITQLVQEYTSYFHGSSSERIQNIQTAAESFKGLLIAPGQEVSMSDILGNISLDNGYAEAPIILGDQTILGVGGGVCQVSTTLFRTAFLAGYPILERHPHAYRVGYYDQINGAGQHDLKYAGLDATVFVPLVDFKFTNDSPYWLLMETYVNVSNTSLTWKFYSTSDGRSVDWYSTGLTDIIDPPADMYIENPDLPSGKVKQTDYAVQGATVIVNRTVTRGGQAIITDRFVTKYEAWPNIFSYGPGTENMPPPSQ